MGRPGSRLEGGLEVSEVGLGCMGMSEFYGPSEDGRSIETLHHAIGRGVTFWDTSDMYGSGHNERLIGRAIAGRRDEVVLATKFGFLRGANGSFDGICGRPAGSDRRDGRPLSTGLDGLHSKLSRP